MIDGGGVRGLLVLSHLKELGNKYLLTSTGGRNSGHSGTVTQWSCDEHHSWAWDGSSAPSNSDIEDRRPVFPTSSECNLGQVAHHGNSNRKKDARKRTVYWLADWGILRCSSFLDKPNRRNGIQDLLSPDTIGKRLHDAEREEQGESKQECRCAWKDSTSKDVSFRPKCFTWKRLQQVPGTAMAKLFARNSEAHPRPLAWLDPGKTLEIEINQDGVAQWRPGPEMYRSSLNDTRSLHRLSWIDRICLVLNQIVFPPLVWILLLSLRLELPSLLDEKVQRLIPHTKGVITFLQGHHTASLILVVFVSGLNTLALLKPPADMSERNRSFAYPCCALSLMAGLLIWTRIGGSILGFFLVFMPYSLSVGMSVGIFLSLRGFSGLALKPLERLPTRAIYTFSWQGAPV